MEMLDLYAGDGVREMMGLLLVPFEEEYLRLGLQFGVESVEDVPPISRQPINNIVGSSSDWVLKINNEIQYCVGITCGGFENQFTVLITTVFN